jgi:hypothetical protein
MTPLSVNKKSRLDRCAENWIAARFGVALKGLTTLNSLLIASLSHSLRTDPTGAEKGEYF